MAELQVLFTCISIDIVVSTVAPRFHTEDAADMELLPIRRPAIQTLSDRRVDTMKKNPVFVIISALRS